MPSNATFESFEKELNRLVQIFGRNLALYKTSGYDEQSLRQEFLNPFFAALGWDMENRAGLIPSHREVIVERRTDTGRADFLFQTARKPRFVCEAKKPSEDLPPHARQAKRYAWTIGIRLAMLSDFEETHFYIANGNPDKTAPEAGLWRSYHYSEYVVKARELWDLLARDNVADGSVEKVVASLPKKLKPVRTKDFDEDFLAFLDGHRRALASDLIRNNDRADLLEGTRLNEAVQCILDRLLFIRICEARGIDTGTKLQSLNETWQGRQPKVVGVREESPTDWGGAGLDAPRSSLWHRIVRHIRALDRRPPSHIPYFNGNLLKPHFSEELVVGDTWLSEFLTSLSEDHSPYKFGYMAVEILGTIYERFLGKIVRPHGRGAVIEEKPEVRKAGGVYYTPRYIVEYIVENTVGKILVGKKPEETLALRFLDPACGSGSFLLRVFERVCEHWQQWLLDNPSKRKKDWCWLDTKTNTLHLTIRAKRQILRATVHGVDLDAQAVEVTQLSLYLKMLEGETTETLNREQDLFGSDEAILPPLQDNIKCGNSLIASDFSMMPEDLVRIHAFDWPVQFASIMRAGGFDAVVGNPPYGASLDEQSKKYIAEKFSTYCYKYDSYIYFIEQAIRLIKTGGYAAYITPELWLKLESAETLRRFIRDKSELVSLRICGENVFEDAVVNTVVFVLRQGLTTQQIEIDQPDRNWFMSDKVWASSEGFAIDYRLHPEIRTVMRHFKASNVAPLSHFGEAIQGITPYDKYRGQTADIIRRRAYHFDHKKDKTCGKWMAGEDIDRYFSSWGGEWLSYGSWLGAAREPRFFTGPRLLFREIPGKERRIQATFVEKETYYHGHSITPFKPNEEKGNVGILYLLALSNSKLLSWYGGLVLPNFGKSIFPKLNPQDIKALPIRQIDFTKPADKARHDKLVLLVDKLLGLMPKLRAVTAPAEKSTLQNAVTAADQQIDELVYELYGLSPEEIALVKRSA